MSSIASCRCPASHWRKRRIQFRAGWPSVLRRVIFRRARRVAIVVADALHGPELAGVVLAFYRHRKRPVVANPPFSGVEMRLTLHRAATPAAQLRFPLRSGQQPARDHIASMEVRDVLFGAGDEPSGRHDAVVFKRLADVRERLNVDRRLQPMGQDDLQSLCHIGQYAVDISVR